MGIIKKQTFLHPLYWNGEFVEKTDETVANLTQNDRNWKNKNVKNEGYRKSWKGKKNKAKEEWKLRSKLKIEKRFKPITFQKAMKERGMMVWYLRWAWRCGEMGFSEKRRVQWECECEWSEWESVEGRGNGFWVCQFVVWSHSHCQVMKLTY